MKSTLRWVVAGLVAAAILLGLGWWLGHRSVTSTAADAQAWRDSTAVLLGEAAEAHQAEVDSVLGVADSLERQARRLVEQRNQASARAAGWSVAADSLQAVLAGYSEIPIDSLAIYPVIVALQDSTIRMQEAALATLDSALVTSEQSRTVQDGIIARQASRLTVLEQQLATTPKPPRLELRLFGGRFRPGCAAGVDAGLHPRLVCGVTVTR